MKSVFVICLVAVAVLFVGPWDLASEEEKGHICFMTIDADENGEVTFEEFVKHLGDDRDKFNSVDQNEDGILTHEEYHDFLGHGSSEQEQQ